VNVVTDFRQAERRRAHVERETTAYRANSGAIGELKKSAPWRRPARVSGGLRRRTKQAHRRPVAKMQSAGSGANGSTRWAVVYCRPCVIRTT